MLKHEDIISKLTDTQKIRILTDISYLSEPEIRVLGAPPVRTAKIKDALREYYPHATILSSSWNKDLWSDVASDKAKFLKANGTNYIEVTGAKIKFSPFRKEISEDPCLASEMSVANQAAVCEIGISSGVAGCYLTRTEAAFMDREPNGRIIAEYLAAPYLKSTEKGGAIAVVSDNRAPSEAYASINRKLQQRITESGKFLVINEADDEETVDVISRGGICLKGSSIALESALKRYQKLKRALDKGDLPVSELDFEISSGNAISEDAINSALDRVLEFAFACATGTPSKPLDEAERDALALKATLESIVLLKNERNILPLKKVKSIALIGDVGFDNEKNENPLLNSCKEHLLSHGFEKVEIERGYRLDAHASNDRMREGSIVSAGADVTLLFLGFDRETEANVQISEKLTLPANQLRFADYITKNNKNVIAVIAAGHAPDIEFTRQFSAVILAPLSVKHSAEALVKVVRGEYNPSGKLAYTLYAATETAFDKQRFYKNALGMKAGPFIGYRYYDTAKMTLGYPFGHGLSYSDVDYSDLSLKGDVLSFTVENKSSRFTLETAEIYIGHDSSSVIRPKKELCAFENIELLPHQSKRVTVTVTPPMICVGERLLVENGKYTVYVARSVKDVKLTAEYHVRDGIDLPSDGERTTDYLQTVSNVISDKYTLEADYSPMKKSFKNILFGICSLAISLSLAVFNSLLDSSSTFLNIISIIIAVAGVSFFIIEAKERAERHKEERKRISEKNSELFENADEIDVPRSESLFALEFDEQDKSESSSVPTVVSQSLEDDVLAYINPSLSFDIAAKQFEIFAEERGFKIESGVISNLFASMASSRIIVVNNRTSKEFRELMMLLSEYFDSALTLDTVNDGYNESSLFYSTDENGNIEEKNVVSAMKDASGSREKIRIAAFDSVKLGKMTDYFNPFMRYAKNPASTTAVIARSESGAETAYVIPGNLWFFINPAAGERVEDTPEHILTISSVVALPYSRIQSSEEHTAIDKFNYYQLIYLSDKQTGLSSITEDFWKKLDKLEAYARKISGFKIGNKLCLGIEKHISTLIAAGVDSESAADSALSVRLMPSLFASVNKLLTKDDASVIEMLDNIFGEDGMPLCHTYVKKALEKKAEPAVVIPEITPEPEIANESAPGKTESLAAEQDFTIDESFEPLEGFDATEPATEQDLSIDESFEPNESTGVTKTTSDTDAFPEI